VDVIASWQRVAGQLTWGRNTKKLCNKTQLVPDLSGEENEELPSAIEKTGALKPRSEIHPESRSHLPRKYLRGA
jgi:hypothetical protein